MVFRMYYSARCVRILHFDKSFRQCILDGLSFVSISRGFQTSQFHGDSNVLSSLPSTLKKCAIHGIKKFNNRDFSNANVCRLTRPDNYLSNLSGSYSSASSNDDDEFTTYTRQRVMSFQKMYTALPAALFNVNDGSSIESAFSTIAPANLRLEFRTQLLSTTELHDTWKHELWIRNVSNEASRDPERIMFEGKATTTGEATANAYMLLLIWLHEHDLLKSFSRNTKNLPTTCNPSNLSYAKLQVYNFCARFGQIPQFIVAQTSNSKQGHFRAQVKLRIAGRDVCAHGDASSVNAAENTAALNLQRQLSNDWLQKNLPTFDVKDPQALNIDNADGFLSFCESQFRFQFHYSVHKVKYFSEDFWAIRVLCDDYTCGDSAVMADYKQARVLANLLAGIHLSQQDSRLFQRYLDSTKNDRGLKFRRMRPGSLVIDSNQHAILESINTEITNYREHLEPEMALHKSRPNLLNSNFKRRISLMPVTSRLVVDDLANHGCNRQGNLFRMCDKRLNTQLYAKRGEILSAIRQRQILLVISSNIGLRGVLLPEFVMEEAYSEGNVNQCNILVSHPRRFVVESLALTVANDKAEALGKTVGYRAGALGLAPRCTGSITYYTAETLQHLLRHSWKNIFDEYSHIMIDQVDERDGPTDNLLTTLKILIQQRIRERLTVPKLVLLSSTVDCGIFSRYFCDIICESGLKVKQTSNEEIDEFSMSLSHGISPIKPARESFAVFEVDDRAMSKVTTKTLSDVLLDLKPYLHDPSLSSLFAHPSHQRYLTSENRFQARYLELTHGNKCIDWVSLWETHKENGEWQIPISLIVANIALLCKDEQSYGGDILVFLPGRSEIKTVHDILCSTNILGVNFNNRSRYQIFQLYSGSSSVPLQSISSDSRHKINRGRWIILSTNIAEHLTIFSSVRYVIDSGKNRVPFFDYTRNLTHLHREWISSSNSRLRSEIASHPEGGIYYALFSRGRLESLPSSLPKKSISSSRLPLSCLRAKDQFPDMSIQEYFAQSLDPPSKSSVDTVIRDLKATGSLTWSEELTIIGKLNSHLPVQPSIGKMMLLGLLFRCAEPMIILASSMNIHQSLFLDSMDMNASPRKSIYSQGSRSDHISIVFAFREIRNIIENNGFDFAAKWARENYLNQKTYWEMFKFIKIITRNFDERLSVRNIFSPEWNVNSNNLNLIKTLLLVGLYPNLALYKSPWLFTSSTGIDALISKHSAFMDNASIARGRLYTPFKSSICCFSHLNLGMEGELGLLRDVSSLSPLMVILFGGRLNLDLHDSNVALTMDNWLPITIKSRHSNVSSIENIVQFRSMWDDILNSSLQSFVYHGAKKYLKLKNSLLFDHLVQRIVNLLNQDHFSILDADDSYIFDSFGDFLQSFLDTDSHRHT